MVDMDVGEERRLTYDLSTPFTNKISYITKRFLQKKKFETRTVNKEYIIIRVK